MKPPIYISKRSLMKKPQVTTKLVQKIETQEKALEKYLKERDL